MTARSGWLAKIAFLLLAGVVTLAILTARAVSRGEEMMSRSDAAFDEGHLRDAIELARRAAVSYAPGAPHVRRAYERLRAIAVGAESTGRPAIARAAWQAVRDASLESRHLWNARRAELDEANDNLSRLMARDERPSSRDRMRAVLERDEAPRGPWILVLGGGFMLIAVGLVWLGLRGFDGRGAPLRRLAWPLLVLLAGVACWTIAVYKA